MPREDGLNNTLGVLHKGSARAAAVNTIRLWESPYPHGDRPGFTVSPQSGQDVSISFSRMKILLVLTSHDQLGDTGRKTGFWLEELAAPYYHFKDAGWEITLASPKGGRAPLDPKSDEPQFQTDQTRRFEADSEAEGQLNATVRLDSVSADDFDTVFYPGGHGPLWDLAEDKTSIALIERIVESGKPIALVCHAPGVLRHATKPDGTSLVAGLRVTGFTDSEEEAMGLTEVVPFLVEDELIAKGADFSKAGNFESYVVTDGLLITGQNPASSGPAAVELISLVEKKEV